MDDFENCAKKFARHFSKRPGLAWSEIKNDNLVIIIPICLDEEPVKRFRADGFGDEKILAEIDEIAGAQKAEFLSRFNIFCHPSEAGEILEREQKQGKCQYNFVNMPRVVLEIVSTPSEVSFRAKQMVGMDEEFETVMATVSSRDSGFESIEKAISEIFPAIR